MYVQLINQYNRYAVHVLNNVASVSETIKYPGQEGDIYASNPASKQRDAVAFLNREVFKTPTWLLNNEILNKIGNPIRNSSVKNIQDRQLSALFSDRVFNTLYTMQQRFGEANTYSVQNLLDDMKNGVWSELRTHQPMDVFRRGVQKSYVNALLRALKESEVGANIVGLLMSSQAAEETPVTTNSDLGPLIVAHLENIRKDILVAIPDVKDKDSKDHLAYVSDYIERSLKKRFETK